MISKNKKLPHVLIVEDEETTQKFLTMSLQQSGFEPTVCNNGATGLYHYIDNKSFDAIILDIMMPEVAGEEFLKIVEILHKENKIKGLSKIIVYTAISNFEQLRYYSSLECVHCVLQKPVSKKRIISELKSITNSCIN